MPFTQPSARTLRWGRVDTRHGSARFGGRILGGNRRVTLNLDISSPIRSLARYRGLVIAIYWAAGCAFVMVGVGPGVLIGTAVK